MSGIDILLQFKSYIEPHQIFNEKKILYYSMWVEKFLIYLEDNKKTEEFNRDDMAAFLRHLAADERYYAWQIRQAGESLCLFLDMMLELKDRAI